MLSLFFKLINLFLAVLGVCRCLGFSLVAARKGSSLAAALGLLVVVASLVVEHRPLHARASVAVARGLSSRSFRAMEQKLLVVPQWLSRPAACGIFLNQGLNP